MGNWVAHIEGHGIHDNGIENDADSILKAFVAELKLAGHAVTHVSFHAGSGKSLDHEAETPEYKQLP